MPNVKISADSTCDLSRPLLRKYDIAISPLYINMGGKSYRDGLDVKPEDLYVWLDQTGEMPKTAAVTVKDYIDLFSPYVLAGRNVVHFTISSKMSACYQNAVLAAKELGNVYVVDSQNLSTGIGHLVVNAAELALQGRTAAEIHEAMEEMKTRVEASFVIDTLKYLHKGGRCSSVAALGANLLSLKPCIEVRDGEMTVGKKYRGSLEKCLANYVADRLKGRTDVDTRRLFITHSAMPPRLAEDVAKQVEKLLPFDEVLDTDAGCTVCNHCGPGTLGILFLRK